MRFVQYSAHDTTLLAMAALLGVDIDAPAFTGYWAFELFAPSEASGGQWQVGVCYNAHPEVKGSVESLQSRTLPLTGHYVPFQALPVGVNAADELLSYMGDVGQMQASAILRQISKWSAAINSGQSQWSDVIALGSKLSAEESKKFKEVFDFFDSDHSDRISTAELAAAFRRLGLQDITHEAIQGLVDFFGRYHQDSSAGCSQKSDEADDGELSYPEYLAMMRVVVGPSHS